MLTASTSSLSSSSSSMLSLLTSVPKPKDSFNLLKSLNIVSRAFASSIICDFVSDDLEVLLLMLLGKPPGIELGGDGSDEDKILFCYIIYLKVCVILFLLSLSKLS